MKKLFNYLTKRSTLRGLVLLGAGAGVAINVAAVETIAASAALIIGTTETVFDKD